MPRVAIRASQDLARLLRQRRSELNLTLREVEERSKTYGKVIPFTTLAKVEQGRVDPGVVRFQQLLEAYDLPKEMALDVVSMETLRAEIPKKAEPQALYEEALRLWRAGQIGQALGHMYALREAVAGKPQFDELRRKAQLHFALVAANLGRFSLSRYLLEQLLREPLGPAMLLRVFVQLAGCWNRLGVHELALAMLGRAETFGAHVEPGEAAWLAHERALIELSRRNYAEARNSLKRARDLYRQAKDDRGVFKADVTLARIHLALGEARQAIRLANQVVEAAAMYPALQPGARVLLGQAQLAGRQSEEAIATLRVALSEAVAADNASARYLAHHYLSMAFSLVGDTERADVERHAAEQFQRYVDHEPDPLVFEGGTAESRAVDRVVPRKNRPRRGNKHR
ncbi:MAG TPA: hypothetical protein VFV75_08275 [Candidatus Polarisedimenticolaceae bacterium]|nr:hypothetical protein [Candidatus Polarisedimenticolaceae bacterium]